MIFKELTVYLAPEFTYSLEQLNEKLASFKSNQISDEATYSVGFVNPISSVREDLVLQLNSMFAFKIKIQEKKVSPSKVKALTEQRITKALEEVESLSREARDDLEDQTRNELTRLEPPKSYYVTAYIDTDTGYLYVGDKSDSRCNALLGLLRKALGSFACHMVNTNLCPSIALREVILERSQLEKGLIAEPWSAVKAVGDKTSQSLSYKDIDLGEFELGTLESRFITQLDMLFCAADNERWCFTLSCKKKDQFFTLSKIVNLPSSNIMDEPLFNHSEENHNANWLILADRLSRMVTSLVLSFGGLRGSEEDPVNIDADSLKRAALLNLPEGMTVTVTEVHNG